MLAYFPAALPDEILYSRLARYHLHVCAKNIRHTMEDLFGDPSFRVFVSLQGHLGALRKRLPPSIRATRKHWALATLFGYHAAFRPTDKRQFLLRTLIKGRDDFAARYIQERTGKRAPVIRLRWCVSCHEEAIAAHGEAYWRRAHQLPYALVCHTHGMPLRLALLPPAFSKHGLLAATAQTCPLQETVAPAWAQDDKQMKVLLRLARESAALLDTCPAFSDFADPARLCRDRFVAAGFMSSSGRLRLDFLIDAAFGWLTWLQEIFPETRSLRWLFAKRNEPIHGFSPFQHLFLDMVLEGGETPPAWKRPHEQCFNRQDVDYEEWLRRTLKQECSLQAAAQLAGVDRDTFIKRAEYPQPKELWCLKRRSNLLCKNEPPNGACLLGEQHHDFAG